MFNWRSTQDGCCRTASNSRESTLLRRRVLRYTSNMETVTRNVRDIPLSDRSALERVVGHQLRETQQVIVNVVNLDLSSEVSPATSSEAEVPQWWKIYEGLSDEEVDRLDQLIRQRATLSPVSG